MSSEANTPNFNPRTYAHKFPGGFRCEFEITITDTTMRWTPENPPTTAKWLREYRRWRDRCLLDFANRSGVLHEIHEDNVHAGFRLRKTHAATPESAYRVAQANLAILSGKTVQENAPGVRDQIVQGYQADLLKYAPRSAGGSA